MKPFAMAALAALAASPVTAFDRMARQDCIDAMEALAELFDPGETDTNALRMARAQLVTGDGWCRIRGRGGENAEAEFDNLDWRAEGITRWTRDGIPPLALELRIDGLEPDEMEGGDANTLRPPLTAEVTLRQIPDAGQLIVERAEMSNGQGDVLAASAVFERVWLTSPSMMQVSIGSIALKAALFDMSLTGEVENPFAFDGEVWVEGGEAARRQTAFDMIEALPDGVSDDATRAELSEFAAALPRPVGRLELSLASENGLGLMQLGASAALQFDVFGTDPAADRSALEILFSGVTLTADCSPGTGQAD